MKNFGKLLCGVVVGAGLCVGAYYIIKKIDETESYNFDDEDEDDFDSDIADDFDDSIDDDYAEGFDREYFDVKPSGSVDNSRHPESDESSGI